MISNIDKEFIFMPKSSIKAGNGKTVGLYPFFTSSDTKQLYIDEYLFDDELIVIGTGGRPSCNYYNGKFSCSTDNFALKSKGQVKAKYLYYFLRKHNLSVLQQGFHGAGLQHIGKDYVKNIKINVESQEKQNKIIKNLDSISKIVENKQKELKRLDEIIKSRFIEMFGRINDTEYKVFTIADLCEFVKDGTHQTPTYTDDTINGYKFLSSKDVTSGKIDWSNIKYIPEELHEKLYKTIKPQRNDILLAKNGTTGIAALVETDDIFDIYVSLAILRFKQNNNPKFMLYAINNDDTKEQFDESLKGVGVPNLHLGEIKKTKLIVPPIELQNEYVKFIEQVDKSKFSVQKEIELYQELLDKKMDEYFG